jgi:hypothetical protein
MGVYTRRGANTSEDEKGMAIRSQHPENEHNLALHSRRKNCEAMNFIVPLDK